MQILRTGFNKVIKEVLKSTVFLFDLEDKSSGTGFFASGELNGKRYHFLITAKHVLTTKEKISIGITYEMNQESLIKNYELKLLDGNKNPLWFTIWDLRKEIDVAILPIDNFLSSIEESGFLFFDLSTFADNSIIDKEEIVAGCDILFSGYPLGINSKHPILRSGIIATPPQENIGDKPYFLVDAQFFPGSSGSPVFWPMNEVRLNITTGRIEHRTGLDKNTPFLLLGVGTAFIQHIGKIEGAPFGTFYKENSGLGAVYRAQVIKNLIFEYMLEQQKNYLPSSPV